MFKAIIGDLFASQTQTLVNTVNCVGVMGKGVAEQFKARYPDMFDDYKRRTDRRHVRLGEPYLYVSASGARIINFPTKAHWRSPSRLADIEKGLDYLAAHVEEWGITSLALPPLGCGNGGLDWSEVGPLVYRKLARLPVDVEIYAPYGTPKTQLTEKFLSEPSQMSLEGNGQRLDAPKPEWVVIMEVLRELEAQPYANPVGRTIFQKISYVLTMMGVPTGFGFGKGSYGPFSGDVKVALHDFANRNWLHEQQLGRMIALRVSPQYANDRNRFKDQIRRYAGEIAKTVDLFSRIKNTEQAEEVLTVLFASRQLEQLKRGAGVAEQEIYDYILEWKKSWKEDEKRLAVARTIRNLVLLGWMRLSISESLSEPEAA
jgi:O-acetyl-ADP-ribose deacetylase (regulator of RNase III)